MISFVSLNTIVTDLLNTVRGAKISQSETISRRQIEDWVNQYRAILIKQDIDKGKMPNPDYTQKIPSLRMEVVDKTADSELASDTYIMRTVLELPNTIDFNFKSGFTYVGTLDGKEIQFVPEGRTEWQQFKRFTSKNSLAYLNDKHIYINTVTPLSHITVRGIFEIPMEAGRLINPALSTQTYGTIDSRYPIPMNMVPVLKEMILQKELGIIAQAPSDNTNDGVNIVSPNGGQKRQG
jgi:hypothetical protein